MVKFLKVILFIIILAFAFALGVKFSDSFKGNMGNLNDDEMAIQDDIEKSFNDAKEELYKVVDNHEANNDAPLTEEEKNDVKNIEASEYVDIEVAQPMDNIEDIEIGTGVVNDIQQSNQDFNNNEQHTVNVNNEPLENQPMENSIQPYNNQQHQIKSQNNDQIQNDQAIQPNTINNAYNNSNNVVPTNSQSMTN